MFRKRKTKQEEEKAQENLERARRKCAKFQVRERFFMSFSAKRTRNGKKEVEVWSLKQLSFVCQS
jgi:hypothetical protein